MGRSTSASQTCSSGCADRAPRPRMSPSPICFFIISVKDELARLLNLVASRRDFHRLRAAAIARGARRRIADAADRLQRRHAARRRHQRTGRIPRSRDVGVVADRRRMAAERRAGVCSRTRSSPRGAKPPIAPLHLHANPGFRRERQRGVHFRMRRFRQPKAPALRDYRQKKDTFHPRKRLAHASSRSSAERKIREPGTTVVPVRAPAVGIESLRLRKVARVPMDHPGAHHDQRTREKTYPRAS